MEENFSGKLNYVTRDPKDFINNIDILRVKLNTFSINIDDT